MAQPTSDVAKRSAEVESQKPALDMVTALMGGTTAMREAGAKYLPRWPAESPKAYDARLVCATLRPTYKRTVSVLVGKPMSKPITLAEDFPESQKALMENVDREGRNLDAFVADILECSIADGHCHIMVDSPKAGPNLSIEQEKKAGIRPYFVRVKKGQVLGWKFDEANNLSMVRYMEEVTIPDGEYNTKIVKQIRVLKPGKWTTYRRPEASGPVPPAMEEWVEHDTGKLSVGTIPFATVYGRRVKPMVSEPPMLELAHLNIKHWQSQCDQDNIAHVMRVPILTVIGAEDSFELVVGAQSAVKLPVGADMRFVEHSGSAVGAGKVSIDDLVEEMRQAGAEMLVQRGIPLKTATQFAGEQSASMSDLQRIVRGCQDSINLALQFMNGYMRDTKPGTVMIHNDFDASFMTEQSANIVMQSVTAGVLSKQTAFSEFQRRGIISGELDWEEEQAQIDEEGPPKGKIDPATGLPYAKASAPPSGGKIDPHTGLPYTQPVDPVAAAAAKAKMQ